jgi:Mg2+-importing ATPase
MLMQDWLDASIVLAIVLISALLGCIQEYRATHAVEQLRQQISIKTTVIRDGRHQIIPADEVVPGDIILLSADQVKSSSSVSNSSW